MERSSVARQCPLPEAQRGTRGTSLLCALFSNRKPLMPLINIDGRHIEYRTIPGDAGRRPLVFLHEGLGSVALWRDFPDKVARRMGAQALVYSRFGYGQSDG